MEALGSQSANFLPILGLEGGTGAHHAIGHLAYSIRRGQL